MPSSSHLLKPTTILSIALLLLAASTTSTPNPRSDDASPLVGRQSSIDGTEGVGCAALTSSSNETYSPSAVRACLESVPFQESVRTNTIDYIKGMLTIDVFEENHKDTTEDSVLRQGVDTRSRLDEMMTKVYTSDYAFQRDVADLMWDLNDGHYYWSELFRGETCNSRSGWKADQDDPTLATCYDFFATAHGIPLVALSTDPSTQASIYIAPDISPFARAYRSIDSEFYAGLDVSTLAGARVTKIEGVDVWDRMDELAQGAGVYQDIQQRLNSLFASPLVQYGTWDHDPGRFTAQRGFEQDSFGMTIIVNGSTSETEIQVPWRTYWTSKYPFSFQSGESFWSSRCSAGEELPDVTPTNSTIPLNTTESFKFDLLPSGSRLPEFGRRAGTSPKSERIGHVALSNPATKIPIINSFISANNTAAQQTLYRTCPPVRTSTVWPFPSSVDDPTRNTAYLGGRDIQFYALDASRTGGTKTGVIYVTTFDPQPAEASCFNRYVLDIILGLQNFTQAGVERILVDTSNNGGGYVYLSGVLQLALAGGQYEPDLNFEVLFRKSPLSEAALAAYIERPTFVQGYWNPQQFLDSDANPLTARDNWMNPGVSFPVGSSTLSASNRVQFATENSFAQIEGVNPIAPFTSNEIIFTGNGLCGSACGGFTSFLAEYKSTTGFISTARPDQPITYTAFSSGNAVSSYYVDLELLDIGVQATNFRPDLLTTAELGFSMSGSLSPRLAPGQFIQYRPLSANGTFSLTEETYGNPVRKWEGVASRYFSQSGDGDFNEAGRGSGSGGSGNGALGGRGLGLGRWMTGMLGLGGVGWGLIFSLVL